MVLEEIECVRYCDNTSRIHIAPPPPDLLPTILACATSRAFSAIATPPVTRSSWDAASSTGFEDYVFHQDTPSESRAPRRGFPRTGARKGG
jgi:hypothetical protein